MQKSLFFKWFLLALFSSVLVYPSMSWAFYSYSDNGIDVSLGGFLGAGGGFAQYPGDGFYLESTSGSWFGDFRLLADGGVGESLAAHINVLQNVRSSPVFIFTGSEPLQKDVDRSGIFYWQQHDTQNTQAAMVLDTAYFEYGNRSNELSIGRQPISTTVTFFFTPNDFFAPFSPNTFFRVYKPGVDAIRFERRLKALSQLSVMGVLGYEPVPVADSGWSDAPDWERTSVLGRATHTTGEFEWGILAGTVRETVVAGFSLQGELFEWFGLRAEGNYADSWVEELDSGLMATISLEHRFATSLTMRIEYMFNGYGADSITQALIDRRQGVSGQGYLGRHYTAFDLSYEFTPLLFGEVLYLQYWSDSSFSVSFNSVYSVSNESELALTAILPGGSEPEAGMINSELGSLPTQIFLEYRYYF